MSSANEFSLEQRFFVYKRHNNSQSIQFIHCWMVSWNLLQCLLNCWIINMNSISQCLFYLILSHLSPCPWVMTVSCHRVCVCVCNRFQWNYKLFGIKSFILYELWGHKRVYSHFLPHDNDLSVKQNIRSRGSTLFSWYNKLYFPEKHIIQSYNTGCDNSSGSSNLSGIKWIIGKAIVNLQFLTHSFENLKSHAVADKNLYCCTTFNHAFRWNDLIVFVRALAVHMNHLHFGWQ